MRSSVGRLISQEITALGRLDLLLIFEIGDSGIVLIRIIFSGPLGEGGTDLVSVLDGNAGALQAYGTKLRAV